MIEDPTTHAISILAVSCLIMPLALKRSLAELTHFSMLGLFAIFYIIFVNKTLFYFHYFSR